jgi:RNA polymerase sigma factor (TIGR02999 family)
MDDVTRILSAMEGGDARASDALLPVVYDELRRLAARRLAREQPGQTLEPTALVHEAYLRLVGPMGGGGWEHRGHFFAAAAEAMRRILVEAARRKASLKRGGEVARVDRDVAELAAPRRPAELLAVDEALGRLADVDSRAAELVKLRYFAGLSMADAASALGLSMRTAERTWTYARAWLRRAIEGEDGPVEKES